MNLRTVLICWILFIQFGGIVKAQLTMPEISFNDYLIHLGHKFNIYFTIESSYKDIRQYQDLSFRIKESPLTSVSNISSGLMQLIPHYLVIQDPNNPRVFNIIKASLLKDSNYVMNQIPESVDFKGTMADYIDYLGAKDKLLRIDSSRPTAPIIIEDSRLPVDVSRKGITVRSALSSSFPEHYDHVLWSATTDSVTHQTSVRVPGSQLDSETLNDHMRAKKGL
jgi:hypothetical protein